MKKARVFFGVKVANLKVITEFKDGEQPYTKYFQSIKGKWVLQGSFRGECVAQQLISAMLKKR